MNNKFNPPAYDLDDMNDDVAKKKHFFNIYLKYADKGKDIHITQMGYKTIFDLMSSRAFKDFDNLSPEYIDKYTDLQKYSFAKTFFGAVMHLPTNSAWKYRKTTFTKTIGLNFSRRYISTMLSNAKKLFDEWKEGDTHNFIPIINRFTLKVISSIILGNDFDEKFRKMKYKHHDGSVETLDVYQLFPILGKDLMKTMQRPINALFPVLIDYNIGSDNKINSENIKEFRSALKDFLDNTTDQESSYAQIKNECPEYSYEDLFNDLMGWLFDGYETLSECISTTLYHLNKNPECHKKVMEELKQVGFTQDENLIKSITYPRLQELNYLTMVIKESLRIDPPLPRSMHFYAKADITIAGVPLPKNSLMSMTFIARHYDPEQWHEPYKYIPERFDPDHELYLKPGTKSPRDQLSFVAFSNSVRKCPALTFAYLELKTILVYFLSRFEYKVDQELLDNNHVKYAVTSTFPLNMTITKKMI